MVDVRNQIALDQFAKSADVWYKCLGKEMEMVLALGLNDKGDVMATIAARDELGETADIGWMYFVRAIEVCALALQEESVMAPDEHEAVNVVVALVWQRLRARMAKAKVTDPAAWVH